jgi:hypothetical protein
MFRLVLVLAAAAPFLQSLAFGYVLDDTYAIRGNAALTGWSSLGRVWLEQFGGDGGPFFGLYRPLTSTLFALLWNAGGKWPLWFHVMALLLHVAATLLVWALLRRALSSWPAFLAALWFAVHPVHVEAVANVTNTSEILVAIWTVLLALLLWPRVKSEDAISWRTSFVAAAMYLAAMLSKESGAMAAPVALLIAWGWHHDHQPTARWLLARWWRLGVAFAVAVAMVAVMRASVLGGPVTGEPIAALGIADMSAPERIAAMVSLIPKIARLLVWPPGVNPYYGPSTFPEPRVLHATLGLLLVVALVSLGARVARRADRRLLAAFGVAAMAFLPASNLLVATGQVLAERTLYVPSIGAVMALGMLLDRARDWTISRSASTTLRRLGVTLVGMLLLWSAVRAARWTDHWRNHDRLFARMIAADPEGYAGYWLAGVEATLQQRPSEGLALFERAFTLERRDRGLILDLGAALTNHGQFDRAASVYREGLKLAPRDSTLNARLRALPRR